MSGHLGGFLVFIFLYYGCNVCLFFVKLSMGLVFSARDIRQEMNCGGLSRDAWNRICDFVNISTALALVCREMVSMAREHSPTMYSPKSFLGSCLSLGSADAQGAIAGIADLALADCVYGLVLDEGQITPMQLAKFKRLSSLRVDPSVFLKGGKKHRLWLVTGYCFAGATYSVELCRYRSGNTTRGPSDGLQGLLSLLKLHTLRVD